MVACNSLFLLQKVGVAFARFCDKIAEAEGRFAHSYLQLPAALCKCFFETCTSLLVVSYVTKLSHAADANNLLQVPPAASGAN